MKRAVATITVYVYGETEQEILEQTEKVCEGINNIEIEHDASVESIILKPHGKLPPYKEIK